MGSINTFKKSNFGGWPPGKITASLNKKLQAVRWGEYKLEELFAKVKTPALKYKTGDLPSTPCGEYVLPVLTAGVQNQGLNNYIPRYKATILKNVISISANGANTGATFYQSKEFAVLQDAYAIRWTYTDNILTDNQYLFLTGCVSKTIYGNYEWTNKAGWERIKGEKIQLPINNDGIDFDFMESFIAELEAQRIAELSAYLKASGFDNYELSAEEQKALREYPTITWSSFNLENLFGKATRGKRLKSADRIAGNLPFVTAGEASEGISAHIGNNVEVFSKNTTTIDMFGSAKYRNYEYGADDHIAVVHTDKLPVKASIFVTSAIHKASHTGKFDYGHNFYAKDADALDIMLPEKDEQPDYTYMETLISAIHKLVIKDVVKYSDAKIKITKKVTSNKQ